MSTAKPGGITVALLLAESHLAVHTWRSGAASRWTVYVCNFTSDNCAKAQWLFDTLVVAFRPGRQNVNRIERGDRRVDPGLGGRVRQRRRRTRWHPADYFRLAERERRLRLHGALAPGRRCSRRISTSRCTTRRNSGGCSAGRPA